MFYPFYKEITYQSPIALFAQVANEPWSMLLESSAQMSPQARYSFIVTDPFLTLTSKNGLVKIDNQPMQGDPFTVLQTQLDHYPMYSHHSLPPFQGGAVGYFSYELIHHLENIPLHSEDDMQFADLAIGFYDVVLAFDHQQQQAWIFSSGYPELDPHAREFRSQKRCEEILKKLYAKPPATTINAPLKKYATTTKLHSPFTSENYQSMVQKVIEYIIAGDIFQANVSQRFTCPLPETLSPFALYLRLRDINPSFFAAYLNIDDTIIASASPERFLKLQQGLIETRPIKGTRPRDADPTKDRDNQQELIASEKDQAENVMIVDVLRNDLARVCKPHTIKVEQLCQLESYATVHHLVSTITGELSNQYQPIDLLRATFPGGSITGAPKIRAMEIIAELEPTARGPYCGCIGYIGFDGNLDTSIVIRTYAIKNNLISFQVGGGIVADSEPLAEYQETLTKAAALLKALGVIVNE